MRKLIHVEYLGFETPVGSSPNIKPRKRYKYLACSPKTICLLYISDVYNKAFSKWIDSNKMSDKNYILINSTNPSWHPRMILIKNGVQDDVMYAYSYTTLKISSSNIDLSMVKSYVMEHLL